MSLSEPRPGATGRVENIAVWGLIVVLGLLFAALRAVLLCALLRHGRRSLLRFRSITSDGHRWPLMVLSSV